MSSAHELGDLLRRRRCWYRGTGGSYALRMCTVESCVDGVKSGREEGVCLVRNNIDDGLRGGDPLQEHGTDDGRDQGTGDEHDVFTGVVATAGERDEPYDEHEAQHDGRPDQATIHDLPPGCVYPDCGCLDCPYDPANWYD